MCSGAEAGAKRGKEEEGHSAIPCRKERGRSCEVERVECVLFFSLRADIMVARKEERERGDRDRRRRMLSEVLNWVKTLIPHHRASYSCPSPSLFLLLIFHNASFSPLLPILYICRGVEKDSICRMGRNAAALIPPHTLAHFLLSKDPTRNFCPLFLPPLNQVRKFPEGFPRV